MYIIIIIIIYNRYLPKISELKKPSVKVNI
jgi:hypothetical protein